MYLKGSQNVERLEVVVTGRVQGVNFRFYTQREAQRLKLCGYVLNRPDGSVEVVAEGERAALKALLAWLHQGPPAARVEQLTPHWAQPAGGFARFEVRS